VVDKHAQQVGQQGDRRQPGEHDRDQAVSGGVRRVSGRGEARSDHAEHDRAHRDVLVPSRVLAEHSLGEEHQHQ